MTRILFLTILLCLSSTITAQDYIIEDAERFAEIFQQNPDSITPETLQIGYLDPGTQGIKIFTWRRIKNAKNMANMVSKYRKSYQKGVELMLPAARTAADESAEVLGKIQKLFDQKKSAPVYIVFGGNNSGGTASSKGLVIGLEVLGRFVDNETDAIELIKSFVAHEVVHVYQARVKANPGKSSLLGQSLREGFADFIENMVMGKVSKAEAERQKYGLANEAQLWEEYQAVMLKSEYQPWMYGKGKDGRPSDLGYWVGKKICESYYNKADDKNEALMTLLKLKNPKKILEESGYNPGG